MVRGLLLQAGDSLEGPLGLASVLKKAHIWCGWLDGLLGLALALKMTCVRWWWCFDWYRWFGLDRRDLAEESVTCSKEENERLKEKRNGNRRKRIEKESLSWVWYQKELRLKNDEISKPASNDFKAPH